MFKPYLHLWECRGLFMKFKKFILVLIIPLLILLIVINFITPRRGLVQDKGGLVYLLRIDSLYENSKDPKLIAKKTSGVLI